MKLAILSDIHANLEALRATLDDVAAQGAERILCLGDIVGYNTNPNECVALLREHDAVCIAGNHDRAVTGQITTERFSAVAARAAAWTRERIGANERDYLAALPSKAVFENILVMVHGALHPETGSEMVRLDTDERRRMSFDALAAHPSGARICLFGHTHRVGIFERRGTVTREIEAEECDLSPDAYYLINPGSVGQPRIHDKHASYMLLDTARRHIALRRVNYDFAASFAKTRRAGLAPPFSFVPRPVRARIVSGLRAVGLDRVVRRLTG